MIPQSQPKKPVNSSKVNLIISAVVHGVLILGLVYFAAREGYLGKTVKTLVVTRVEEKKPEPEKPKSEPPKVEPPKVETPKVEAPKVEAPKETAPAVAPPVVAPAAVDVPSFEFAGGKSVVSENDPVQLYKGFMEYSLRSKWDRPENADDINYVVEVQVDVDKQGNLSHPVWQKETGNTPWDQSVRKVFKEVTHIDRAPPTNFPPQVVIRFDVQEESEPVITP